MSSAPDYTEKIPNNVDLRGDRRLQRALESWQPNFLHWWESMGPTLPTQDAYLRTAVNVGREGWAHFGHVPMKDYRHLPGRAERRPPVRRRSQRGADRLSRTRPVSTILDERTRFARVCVATVR
jgi:hypothetical protein